MYRDGKFSVQPIQFNQLFILLAEFHGRPRPLGFIVLTKRDEKLYVEVFEFLRNAFFIKPGQFLPKLLI